MYPLMIGSALLAAGKCLQLGGLPIEVVTALCFVSLVGGAFVGYLIGTRG